MAVREWLVKLYLSKRGTCNGHLLNGSKELLWSPAQVLLNDLGDVLVGGYRALVQHVVPHDAHILSWQNVVLHIAVMIHWHIGSHDSLAHEACGKYLSSIDNVLQSRVKIVRARQLPRQQADGSGEVAHTSAVPHSTPLQAYDVINDES